MPTKVDAFWNIHEILQNAGCSKEFFPFFPVKRGDDRKEAIRACNPALSEWLHNGSRHAMRAGRFSAAATIPAEANLLTASCLPVAIHEEKIGSSCATGTVDAKEVAGS